MVDGFVRVGVATPDVKVADTSYNSLTAISAMKDAAADDVAILVLPELHLTSYTCQDLFFQTSLQTGAVDALLSVIEASATYEVLTIVGVPLVCEGKLYNCAAVVEKGRLLAVIPKTYLPNYHEFYEMRWFASACDEYKTITVGDYTVPFTTDCLIQSRRHPDVTVAVEICEDLWAPNAPSIAHSLAGATIIANLSASNDLIGKREYRRNLVNSASGRYSGAYLYACAGPGESTTDVVFLGHDMISENGVMLAESDGVFTGLLYSEIDVEKLKSQRMRNTTFAPQGSDLYTKVFFDTDIKDVNLTRYVDPYPFVPSDETGRERRCEEILTMQSMGLVKRLEHIGNEKVVVGISGGLDSTLALLVCVRAFDYLKLARDGIIAVTMPCFGTTKRTKGNAGELAKALKVTLREIDITRSVRQHFSDIGHDESDLSVTYENSQARERTQVLMDIANSESAIVVGTGDLSELALGWATYNGDHMSMYGVNSSIPKTLIKHLVRHAASLTEDVVIRDTLHDILDTPVSPELLPAINGTISQVTEDLVGPYELHDFFLYWAVRWAFSPKKVYHLALYAFKDGYEKEVIKHWLKVFYKRFFSQQFKRSCLPDGPKVGSVALSPRGDLRMPSDARSALWIDQVGNL